jgi:selenocysteine lyase/cysteine desulfurase
MLLVVSPLILAKPHQGGQHDNKKKCDEDQRGVHIVRRLSPHSYKTTPPKEEDDNIMCRCPPFCNNMKKINDEEQRTTCRFSLHFYTTTPLKKRR